MSFYCGASQNNAKIYNCIILHHLLSFMIVIHKLTNSSALCRLFKLHCLLQFPHHFVGLSRRWKINQFTRALGDDINNLQKLKGLQRSANVQAATSSLRFLQLPMIFFFGLVFATLVLAILLSLTSPTRTLRTGSLVLIIHIEGGRRLNHSILYYS